MPTGSCAGRPRAAAGRRGQAATGGLALFLISMAASIVASGCNRLLLNGNDSPADASVDGFGMGLTRESHGVFFPIGLGSFHVNQTCDDCHGGFRSFKEYTCQSCHAHATDVAAGRHTFITGFQNNSTGCFTCHPNGRETVISIADHSAKYFAIDTGPHAALNCTDCHAWVTTSRPFTCVGCHPHDQDVTATLHASITNYRYDSNGCFGCHPNGREVPMALSDHSAGFFPIMTGSHKDMACASCHTDPNTSKTFVCTVCHSQATSATQHATVANYMFTDAACFSCHPKD